MRLWCSPFLMPSDLAGQRLPKARYSLIGSRKEVLGEQYFVQESLMSYQAAMRVMNRNSSGVRAVGATLRKS